MVFGESSYADGPEVYRDRRDSVVLILGRLDRGTVSQIGSGVLVGPDTHILTNWHVVKGAKQIDVMVSRGDREPRRILNVQIVAADRANDLALLGINPRIGKELKDQVAPIADQAPEAGQEVFALGHPVGATGILKHTITKGVVSAVAREVQGQTMIQHSAQINGGNSGGPLFDTRGRVVGINTAKIIGLEGVAFAVGMELASPRRLLDSFPFDAAEFDPLLRPDPSVVLPEPPTIRPRTEGDRKLRAESARQIKESIEAVRVSARSRMLLGVVPEGLMVYPLDREAQNKLAVQGLVDYALGFTANNQLAVLQNDGKSIGIYANNLLQYDLKPHQIIALEHPAERLWWGISRPRPSQRAP